MAPTHKPPHDTDDRRGMERHHTGKATHAADNDVRDELDRKTHRPQRRCDSDSPPQRH